MQTIIIADPDPDYLEWAAHQLESPTTRVLATARSDDAYRLCFSEKADLVIAEMLLQPYSGTELLVKIRAKDQQVLFLMVGAFGTTQAVIESVKLGAFDFLRKEQLPFNLKKVVEEALQAKVQLRAATAAKPQLTVEQHQDSLVGSSDVMQQVFKMIGRVSHSDASVMVTGESGSGKELVARAIHNYSRRSSHPFVAINCAAIPDALLESELFGHERGSFTGAVTQRVGRFEQSRGGTLFLDEIGDIPLPLQSKLLRVLQENTFSRVGGNETLSTDVRIVAATNKNLEQEVEDKRFRGDLFYRLNVVRIHLPPLRERSEDIPLLCEYFLGKISSHHHLPRLRLSDESLQLLENYHWPGNVRELENVLQRAAIMATTDVLLPRDIPLEQGEEGRKEERGGQLPTESVENAESIRSSMGAGPREQSDGGTRPSKRDEALNFLLAEAAQSTEFPLLPWLEREFIIAAMRMTGGNQLRAARLLGITRATLRKRIERFGITKQVKMQ